MTDTQQIPQSSLKNVAKLYYNLKYDLIPLRPGGKAPIFKEWTSRKPHSATELREFIEAGNNLGVRLSDHDLLIDVDVKNDQPGLLSLKALLRDVPALALIDPITATPSGGCHYLYQVPEDDTGTLATHVDAYPGIEFLSHGRQALIGGCSIEGGIYTMDSTLLPAPLIPSELLAILKRPRGDKTDADNLTYGILSGPELADYLEGLKPELYQDYSQWLHLGMACHFLTAGTAMSEFLDWSEQDPMFRDMREENEAKWESFSVDRSVSITGRRLVRELRKHHLVNKAHQLMNQISPGSGFDDESMAQDLDAMLQISAMISGLTDITKREQVFAAIARARLSVMDTDILYRQFKDKFKNQVTMAGLRAETNDAIRRVSHETHKINRDSEDRTDIDNFITDMGGTEAVVFSQSFHYIWDKAGSYVPYNKDAILGKLDWWLNAKSLENTARRLQDMRLMLVAATEIDADKPHFWEVPHLTNGGMINLSAGELWLTKKGWELRKHDMQNRQRTRVDVEFQANSPAPEAWLEYLDFALRGEHHELMKRRLAVGIVYSLMSSSQWLKKAWLLYGPADTGKSKVLDLVKFMVGSRNCSSLTFQEMQANHGTSGLIGKMANFQGEISKAEKVNPSLFKSIVGGDSLSINPKGGTPFSYICPAVLWFAGNDIPSFTKGAAGVASRIVMIEFANAKADEALDKNLLDKFKHEIDDIFNWALNIFYTETYLEGGPGTCLEKTTDEEKELDHDTTPGSDFIEVCIEITADYRDFVYTEDIHKRYAAHNHVEMSVMSFGRQFTKWMKQVSGLDTVRVRKGRATTLPQNQGWYGIKLKEEKVESF